MKRITKPVSSRRREGRIRSNKTEAPITEREREREIAHCSIDENLLQLSRRRRMPAMTIAVEIGGRNLAAAIYSINVETKSPLPIISSFRMLVNSQALEAQKVKGR